MSRSLHATSTETETETTTIINNKMESSVVASNNIANNNKKHASMSSSQIPVLSKVRSLKNLSCFSWRLLFLLYAIFIELGSIFGQLSKKKYLFKDLIVVFYLFLFGFANHKMQTQRKNCKCLT